MIRIGGMLILGGVVLVVSFVAAAQCIGVLSASALWQTPVAFLLLGLDSIAAGALLKYFSEDVRLWWKEQ